MGYVFVDAYLKSWSNPALQYLLGGDAMGIKHRKRKPSTPKWWQYWDCCVMCTARNACGNCPHAKGIEPPKQDKIALEKYKYEMEAHS